jgi:AtzE family amidohydrolase
MIEDLTQAGALAIASAVKARQVSAVEVARAALQRIEAADPVLNAFTALTSSRALAAAEEVDCAIARGEDPGPLAGVPFGVKNLFDIQGIATLAGSKIRAGAAVAERDATVVHSLSRAGAVLVGALNMDEFAYGFTTENTHYGVTRNPHDLSRVAGGSSGGSGAAVAAGLVQLALGSDTNGSIRVPAAFCGIFGLKPTYGRLSRGGTFQFVESLDCVGPLARSVEDLAAAFDAMQGPDPLDPVCTKRPVEFCASELVKGADGLRIAVAGDYFARQGDPEVFEAVARVARALSVVETVTIPEAGRARAAAYVITGSEGGSHHLQDLRTRAADFDPATRSRFLAGALLPAAWVNFAQRFRSWYRQQLRELFQKVDVILAPSTPCAAIQIEQRTIVLDGKEMLSRPNIGIFTQPISFVGLPVISAPVHLPGKMPLGVQLIAAPYKEAQLLRVAYQLEQDGVAAAPVATQFQGAPA